MLLSTSSTRASAEGIRASAFGNPRWKSPRRARVCVLMGEPGASLTMEIKFIGLCVDTWTGGRCCGYLRECLDLGIFCWILERMIRLGMSLFLSYIGNECLIKK